MNRRKKRFAFVMLVSIVSVLSGFGSAGAQKVHPTPEWVNFYSPNIQINGELAPVGTIVEAFDGDSVLCGRFVTHKAGKYGFLPVYRDDPTTSDRDEGAMPGDTIFFKVNGHLAQILGPEPNIWTARGEQYQVDLSVEIPAAGNDPAQKPKKTSPAPEKKKKN